MELPPVNYMAVAAGGVLIFILGGLWYSPVMFARPWIRLMGKSEEELRAGSAKGMPLMFLQAFICGLLVSYVLARIVAGLGANSAADGAVVGALCWTGLTGATSYANALFSMKPRQLWLIDSGYNLVSFVLVGILLAAWR